ncbi:hypothetical protein WICPIJ_005083 [Wickerhamomyces pijperi]|uniref:DNA 3'-5' helicase n=1 Tax=Wickerhamomyces pijperi TaxID=599730 RepID=A0A9P8Q6N5_WICPI|nr:hypothetical protein WICPIJ_005083 [Wickerhamomyces pijperi]
METATNVTIKEVSVTQEQLDIIQSPVQSNNALFIKSGPGTGKTHTLVLKLAHLINELNIPPQDILVLSMTNKAVDNIKDRLKEYVTKDHLQSLRVHTFHAYCHDLVSLNYGDGIEVLEGEGLSILAVLFNHKRIKNGYLVSEFLKCYQRGDTVQDIAYKFSASCDEVETWINIFEKMDVTTFDEILKMGRDIIYEYVESGDINYKAVVVDEVQDMYHGIYDVVRSVTSEDTHVVVSGDLNQSIYEFLNEEGQDPVALTDLPKVFDELEMSRSFRSTQEILDASEYVLDKEVNLFSDKSGPKPFFNFFESDADQTQFTLDQIKHLHSAGVPLNDIAVLIRTNEELKKFAGELDKQGIEYIKLSALSKWLQNENFLYFIHYLRILLKPETSNFQILGTLNLLPRLGPKRLREIYEQSMGIDKNLYEYLVQSKKPHLKHYISTINHVRDNINFNDPKDILTKLLYLSSKLGLAQKLHSQHAHERKRLQEQMVEFYNALKYFYEHPDRRSIESQLAEPRTPIESFLNGFMNLNLKGKTHNKLIIGTLHQCKGLEFPAVFINSTDIETTDSQEKNLLYVGMTRPKSLLYVNVLDSLGKLKGTMESEEHRRYFQAGKPHVNLLKSLFNNNKLVNVVKKAVL